VIKGYITGTVITNVMLGISGTSCSNYQQSPLIPPTVPIYNQVVPTSSYVAETVFAKSEVQLYCAQNCSISSTILLYTTLNTING
jgi:hypothetical protein